MGHMRGRLLAVVLTAFYYKMAVETADIKVLDMAPDAVDDQYDGCRDQVLKKIKSGLLDEELQSSENFKAAWNANKPCTTLIPGGVMEHTAAMLAYQNGNKGFLKEFNGAVESLGGNSTLYDSKFQFKSLHFLLMDSMKLLNKGKCQTVYRYAETGKYKVQPGSEIRFGMFLEVTPDKALLGELDGGVLFSITSCSTLNLMDTKCNTGSEIEMLLSPVEVFKVEAVTDVTGDDDEAYKHIILKHSNYSSNNNCYLFPETGSLPDAAATTKPGASTLAGISTQYLGSVVMVLMAVSLFLLTC